MAHPVQLEISGREFLRRQLPQYQSPLGRSGRHWTQRQRPPRHARAANGAPAAGVVLRAWPPNRCLSLSEGPAGPTLLSALPSRLRIFCALRGRAAEEARRVGEAHWQPRGNFPEYGAAPAPTTDDRRLASSRYAPDRGLALVPRR